MSKRWGQELEWIARVAENRLTKEGILKIHTVSKKRRVVHGTDKRGCHSMLMFHISNTKIGDMVFT